MVGRGEAGKRKIHSLLFLDLDSEKSFFFFLGE